ncbi:MAG TPA: SDR family oxidoreductase, partial [Pirellulales bacterium]|nr:SDR family oxidoreductase [Pirellulales bacterium]
MDFLQLSGKSLLVFGLANRKSVAWHVGQVLTAAGAKIVYVVRTPERRASVAKIAGNSPVFVCDVEFEEQILRLKEELAAANHRFHGLVHSIAFADYGGAESRQPPAFHETPKQSFLRSVDISCFSLIAISNALKDLLEPDASVVAISISTTRMAS